MAPGIGRPARSHIDDQRPDLQAAAEYVNCGAAVHKIAHHLAGNGLGITTYALLYDSVITTKDIQALSRGRWHLLPADQGETQCDLFKSAKTPCRFR